MLNKFILLKLEKRRNRENQIKKKYFSLKLMIKLYKINKIKLEKIK